jgi:polyisoprenoid-binding protein YceI
MVFKSTKIIETGKGVAKVTGDLTFHGVTRPVTLAVKFNAAGANPMTKKYTVGFEVSGKIKRSDFGMNTYVPLIGDDVDLIVSAGFEHT